MRFARQWRLEKDVTDEESDAIGDANLMLTAFENAGVESFHVTLLRGTEETKFHRKQFPSRIRKSLPTWLSLESGVNLILRPCLPKNSHTLIVQLDDLREPTVERIEPFVFCVTETSPNNFQAFVALTDGNKSAAKEIRQRLITATCADTGATGAFRIAGSLNTKDKHRRADGSFPRVQLMMVRHWHLFRVCDLEAAGLLPSSAPVRRLRSTQTAIQAQPAAAIKAPNTFKRRGIGGKILHRVPRYSKALAEAPLKVDGTPDRSKADLFFAKTCLFYWQPPLQREEIATLLLRHSEKAQEHSDPEWYVESTIDAAIELYS